MARRHTAPSRTPDSSSSALSLTSAGAGTRQQRSNSLPASIETKARPGSSGAGGTPSAVARSDFFTFSCCLLSRASALCSATSLDLDDPVEVLAMRCAETLPSGTDARFVWS